MFKPPIIEKISGGALFKNHEHVLLLCVSCVTKKMIFTRKLGQAVLESRLIE